MPEEQQLVAASRSPQILAIVTLLLGLVSALALFNLLFWVFPLVTVALGAMSLASLARNPERIGRKAAWVGVLLAVLFGAWAVSRHFSRQAWLLDQARRNADVWLELVCQEKLQEAHQLHLHENQRMKEEATLDEFYASREEARIDYKSFYSTPPLNEFILVASQATVNFEGLDAYIPDEHEDNLLLRYSAEYQEGGQPKKLEMRLVMRRYLRHRTGEGSWAVYRVMPADIPLPL